MTRYESSVAWKFVNTYRGIIPKRFPNVLDEVKPLAVLLELYYLNSDLRV